LAYFERLVQGTGTKLTVLRASYFQDNVLQAVPFAKAHGSYQCFFPSRDVCIATVATLDVGAIAARALLDAPPPKNEIIDVVGPSYSTTEIAEILGDAVGRKLTILDVQRAEREATFRQFMSPEAARAMFETVECLGSGRLPLCGDRLVRARTRLEQVLREAAATVSTRTPEVHP